MPAFPDLDLKAGVARPFAKSKDLGIPMHGTGRRPLVLMSELYNQDNDRMEVRLYNSVPKTHYSQGVTPCPDNMQDLDMEETILSNQAIQLGEGSSLHIKEVSNENARERKNMWGLSRPNNKYHVIKLISRAFYD